MDSLSATGKLEVMQYDDRMPVAAVTLTRKAVAWAPPEGAALRVRMGKPDGYGVLNDALGVDDRGAVYFAFTRQMTAAQGRGEISIEIGTDDGLKSSAILTVDIKENPVQDDKIQSGEEYLALDAILEQCRQAAEVVTSNAAALQTIQENAASIQTTAANIGAIQTAVDNAAAIQAAPSAASTASEAARSAGNYAEDARQQAANVDSSAAAAKQSQTQAAASEAAAAQSEQRTETAAQTIEANLDAIVAAPEAARQAAQSAEEAKQAAQEALTFGVRTFFASISPDEQGDLDLSEPMTTVAAQPSWTIKSRGDRIQSVQVNGFAGQDGTAGLALAKLELTGTSADGTWQDGGALSSEIWSLNLIHSSIVSGSALFSALPYAADFTGTYPHFYIATSISRFYIPAQSYDAALSFVKGTTLWYTPADGAGTTGLYLPIQVQGHEYRCQCLPLTAGLGTGDNVQSNVPSGCDQKAVFDGSQSALSVEDIGSVYRIIYSLEKTVAGTTVEYTDRIPFTLSYTSNTEHFYAQNQRVHFFLEKSKLNGASNADIKAYFQGHPVILYYRSTEYTPQKEIALALEHHGGVAYAHDPVVLSAVPYTSADSGKTPGTYEVSSQDGTTVEVLLKAMQDGGDASKFQGHTWEELISYIDNKFADVASALLN